MICPINFSEPFNYPLKERVREKSRLMSLLGNVLIDISISFPLGVAMIEMAVSLGCASDRTGTHHLQLSAIYFDYKLIKY